MKYINNNPKFDLVDERNRETLEKIIINDDQANLLESTYYAREHIYRNRYSSQEFDKEPPNMKIIFLNNNEFTIEEEFQNFYISTNKDYKKSIKDTFNHALGIY